MSKSKDMGARSLLEGPLLQSLMKLAVPLVLAQLLQATYQLIDAFWVGRLGGNAVAAVSVTTPITFVSIAVGAGFSIAGSVLIAQFVGARNQGMVDHVAAQTMLMVFLVSVVLAFLGYTFAPDIIRLMGVSEAVFEGALGFMRVSFIGLPFNFMFIMFMSFMRSVGRPAIPLYIIMGTVTLNYILDPILIFGRNGFPALGVMGAAVATLSTQVLAIAIGMGILLRGRQGVHIRPHDFKPDWKYIRQAFNLGLPASIEQSMRGLGLTMMTFLITSFGTTTLASFGVGSNVLQVVMIPALGFSQAISTVVAQNIGAGQIERAERLGRLGGLIAFSFLSVLGLLAFVFAARLVAVFVPEDPAVIAGGAQYLRTMSLAWGFLGFQLAMTGVFKGSGNMVLSMIIALVSIWVLQFPVAYLLSRHTTLGAQGLWYAFPVSNIVIAIVSLVVFLKGDWKKKRLTRDVDEAAALEMDVNKETMVDEGIR
ncbi:MATE family efflux transporter [Chitinophaga horti]|uniref:MATE family efflux transporter n=1 Tax=Chitinophaga horti TaxID=2920382 RepID=A0ABY6J8A4_9BACT|nr:MATE family efflux transporter [Chitinophaga horti]UYQ94514.1 MATE family efflux transporter [Chitinophaga horti]